MIIKSSQRWGTKQLADHLTNNEENEHIHFSDCRGIVADTVHDALDDMDDLSHRSTRCQKHLYHVSVSPDRQMNEKEWEEVWQTYEAEFCLEDRPYIEVTHTKKDGRTHKHRVYERVGDDGRAVELSYTYQRNEKVARILEYRLGHPLTVGKHNRIVMRQLFADGYQDVVDWMQSRNAHTQTRPVAISNHTDYQQQKRTGMTVQQVKADLQAAYQASDNGKSFEVAIAAQGYILARGDRGIVVMDICGGIHSPRRRLEVKAAELKAKWADLNPDHLPTVAEVKQNRKEKPVTVNPILSQQDRVVVDNHKALLQSQIQDEKQRKQKQVQRRNEQIAKSGSDFLSKFHEQNSEVFHHITDGDIDR